MTVWIIAAGGAGEPFLPVFREYKAAVFSYKEGGDTSKMTEAEMIAAFEGKPYLETPRKIISSDNARRYAREMIKIRDHVERGDYLYAPLKKNTEFLIGRVKKDPYRYEPEHDRDHRHLVRTKWAPTVTAAEIAEELGALVVSKLPTFRHTIRAPKVYQAELTAYADKLFQQ
ncbi:hypothetical protein ABTX85_09805 [Streptomyces sp. NPDC096097]|uniref:hypothetical protein n=1 Tax=Streptomyces sp. NPDC096097 TaxID=3155546 RepID=UPI00332B7AF8